MFTKSEAAKPRFLFILSFNRGAMLKQFIERQKELVDPIGLAFFRIAFGLFMAWEMLYLIRIDFVDVYLIRPGIVFGYDILQLPMLPDGLLKLMPLLLLAAACMISLGVYFKQAAWFFGIGFGYLFFLDKCIYNNHLYLSALLAILLALTPADKAFALRPDKKVNPVRRWHFLILQVQICIVYFYGGIAKLNSDWLFAWQPTLEILNQSNFLANILGTDVAAALLVYGGLVFDLGISFLLFWRKSLPVAIVLVIIFNLLNSTIFNDINIFPYMMMAAMVLFMPSEWLRKWSKGSWKPAKLAAPEFGKPLLAFLVIYFIFQFTFPFRHLMFPGNPDWTMEGQRFSWRMKVQHREVKQVEFSILDHQTKTVYPVEMGGYNMHEDQMRLLAADPACIQQFGKYLHDFQAPKLNSFKVEVKGKVQVTFNGRAPQYVVDPDADLSQLKRSLFTHSDWILPLEE